jgi:hypothetical protein
MGFRGPQALDDNLRTASGARGWVVNRGGTARPRSFADKARLRLHGVLFSLTPVTEDLNRRFRLPAKNVVLLLMYILMPQRGPFNKPAADLLSVI